MFSIRTAEYNRMGINSIRAASYTDNLLSESGERIQWQAAVELEVSRDDVCRVGREHSYNLRTEVCFPLSLRISPTTDRTINYSGLRHKITQQRGALEM